MSISSDSYFHHQLQRKTSVPDAALLLAECARAFGWDLAAFHADIEQIELPRSRDGEFIGTVMGWRADTVNAWVEHGLGLRKFIGAARPVRDTEAVASPESSDGAFGIG